MTSKILRDKSTGLFLNEGKEFVEQTICFVCGILTSVLLLMESSLSLSLGVKHIINDENQSPGVSVLNFSYAGTTEEHFCS